MATARPPRVFASFVCNACRQRLRPTLNPQRVFSTSLRSNAEPSPPASERTNTNGLSRLSDSLERSTAATARSSRRPGAASPSSSSLSSANSATPLGISAALDADPSLLTEQFAANLHAAAARDAAHRLHVYATKHNTHITFVQPARAAVDTASSGISRTSASAADRRKTVDVLLSLSTGNIGFRKAGRGSYDAAYQLAAFVLKQIQEKGMLRDVRRLEVVLRGFGAGREAVSKVLLGTEGRRIRGRISAVIDATRLKQGGPRSKKPRRLG